MSLPCLLDVAKLRQGVKLLLFVVDRKRPVCLHLLPSGHAIMVFRDNLGGRNMMQQHLSD